MPAIVAARTVLDEVKENMMRWCAHERVLPSISSLETALRTMTF
jgi:hypothetical protein